MTKIFIFCKKNADTSKIKDILVLKGLFSETTYVCVLQILPRLGFRQKNYRFLTVCKQYSILVIRRIKISALTICTLYIHQILTQKDFFYMLLPTVNYLSNDSKKVDWIMLFLVMNINGHLWGVISTSPDKVSELLLALDDAVTLETVVVFFTNIFSV